VLSLSLALAASVIGLAAGSEARADVSLPAIFSDHMVLQRDQKDKVWGWAEPGEEVSVAIHGQLQSTKAGEDGSWSVLLDPLPAGGPHTLTISGKNNIKFQDVLVGEVWICSGQSNMQWPLSLAVDADLEIQAARFPKIRLITVPNRGLQEPQKTFDGKWEVCSPATVADFSAVGYFFGRQLYQTLGVPIGLIDNSWGGSACEAWVRRDLLEKDTENYGPLMERWKKIEADYPKAKADFEAKYAEWKADAEKAKADNKPIPRPPANPDGLMFGNARPANIYNGALKPTIGYGIRGVIWYQGETNADRAYQYRSLFPLMIQSWRDEWNQGDFPFYWVQLADYLAEKPEPGESAWAELREAQTMTLKLPKTGQAVIIDLGEAKDIHPRDKQNVAKRLARWALARDYGVQIPCQSPRYKSMEKNGNKIVVTLDEVGSGGLKPFDVQEIKGFAIAGADRKFVWAEARLVGPDRVEVTSAAVADPVAVRYAWADNPVCNLYSAEGLPVTPFRTDDWPGETVNNK
jgi:sialate O-acetylesterase